MLLDISNSDFTFVAGGQSNDVLYAGTYTEAFKTSDNGTTWTPISCTNTGATLNNDPPTIQTLSNHLNNNSGFWFLFYFFSSVLLAGFAGAL